MYKYIIVDDESLIRKGIIKQLEPLRDVALCVGEAANGQEAIAFIDDHQPSIVIVDMQMPIMTGTQLLTLLTKEYPDIQIIVISGYKDFDYVKHALSANAIDYVLKPFSSSQIQEAVLKAIQRLEDTSAVNNKLLSVNEEKEQAYYEYDMQTLRDLILGYHNESVRIGSKKLAFVKDESSYLLITVNTSIPIAEVHIQESLDESGYSNMAVFINHPNNLYLGSILFFLTESMAGRYRSLCEQIMDFLSAFLHQRSGHAYFGISQIHNRLSSLSTAYDQCCKALNEQGLQTNQKYYYFFTDESTPRIIHWDKTDEFLFRLEAGMSKEVQELLQKLLEYYLLIPDITLSDVKFHLYGLTNQCWSLMKDYSKQYKPSISMENIVKSIFSIKELIAYYSSFFTNLSNVLKEYRIYDNTDDVIEKVKIYLARNYQKMVSIEIISSYFYLNASYFSFLFHQKTGEKFIDYLNGIRIEKAKEMLLHTDYRIYYIAKSVGYDNVKYFFRVFKKRERIAPEEYRKGFQKNLPLN